MSGVVHPRFGFMSLAAAAALIAGGGAMPVISIHDDGRGKSYDPAPTSEPDHPQPFIDQSEPNTRQRRRAAARMAGKGRTS